MKSAANLQPITCPTCRTRLPAHSTRCDYCGASLLPAMRRAEEHLRDRHFWLRDFEGWLLLGVCLLSALFMLALISRSYFDYAHQQVRYARLAAEGAPAGALVVDKSIGRDGKRKAYYVRYQYPVQRPGQPGELVYTERTFYSVFEALQVGQTVEVLYVPGEPELVALRAGFGPPNPLMAVIEAVLLSIFGLFLLVVAAYSARKLYRLRLLSQRGVLTTGIAGRVWDTPTSKGGRQYHLGFKFTAVGPEGRPVAVNGSRTRPHPYWVKSGEPVPVAYLPENPHIYELLL